MYRNGSAAELVACGTAYLDSPLDPDQGYIQEPIVSKSTPFFYIDLVAAVWAAEKLGLREEEESESGESGPSNGSSQGDVLIDLHD